MLEIFHELIRKELKELDVNFSIIFSNPRATFRLDKHFFLGFP